MKMYAGAHGAPERDEPVFEDLYEWSVAHPNSLICVCYDKRAEWESLLRYHYRSSVREDWLKRTYYGYPEHQEGMHVAVEDV